MTSQLPLLEQLLEEADRLLLMVQALRDQVAGLLVSQTKAEEPKTPPIPGGEGTPFAWPTNERRVTQPFGVNAAAYRPFGLPGHEGVDFAAGTGTPITAVADGTISEVLQNHSAYGVTVRQMVEVEGRKLRVTYAHGQVGSIKVKAGDVVKSGTVLMLADSTGNSSGSHLHITVTETGRAAFVDELGRKWPSAIIDPSPFFGLSIQYK